METCIYSSLCRRRLAEEREAETYTVNAALGEVSEFLIPLVISSPPRVPHFDFIRRLPALYFLKIQRLFGGLKIQDELCLIGCFPEVQKSFSGVNVVVSGVCSRSCGLKALRQRLARRWFSTNSFV